MKVVIPVHTDPLGEVADATSASQSSLPCIESYLVCSMIPNATGTQLKDLETTVVNLAATATASKNNAYAAVLTGVHKHYLSVNRRIGTTTATFLKSCPHKLSKLLQRSKLRSIQTRKNCTALYKLHSHIFTTTSMQSIRAYYKLTHFSYKSAATLTENAVRLQRRMHQLANAPLFEHAA